MVENLFTPTNCEVDSRVMNTSKTLIDQGWVNNQNKVQSSFVIGDTYVSNHLLNGICLRDRHKAGTSIIRTRKITPEKEVAFSNNWSPVLDERDCNRKWELVTNKIKSALDATCPEKEVKIRTDAGPNLNDGRVKHK